ncbi:D-alanyl-D-alanine carboxypeptidase [Streptomyces sp. NPDC057245]|uniref:D-alanyl-D-alanine carboxypeptidase n=1 Tax=Streptomyces sp. NPDC057245 TaxID=3346065 RepID=UPI00362DBB68
MEEASVAGESPDRSKQRESSEEPTSGSAGPVPEARTGTSEARDPRLSVAREDREDTERSAGSTSSASSVTAGSGGGVDTATRVLSVRETDTGTETETETEEGPGTGAGGRGEAGTENRTEADAEASGSPSEDSTRATETAETDTAVSSAPADATDATDASDTAETSKADDRPETADDSDTADRPAAPDTSGTSDTSDTSDAPDASESAGGNNGRLRDAVAAWVATADERAAANAQLKDAQDEDEQGKDAQDEDEQGEDEQGEDEQGEDEQGEDEQGEDEQGEEAAEKRAGDTGKAAEGAGAGEGAPGSDTADGGAEDGDKREQPAEADSDGDADPDAPSRASDASGSDEDSAAGSDRPVDQPTAVFKAPRPDKPAVDQPTTMLKLGDTPTPSKTTDKTTDKTTGKTTDRPGKPEKPGKQPGQPRDVERTSKFVALRQPDDLATRKPPAPPKPPSGAPRTGTTTAVPHVGPERTTQQPVPPKPPLDLLAELTNTPPPPETALRTTVRRVKIWTPLVVLLLIVFAVVQSMRSLPQPTLDLTAQESFTFEGGKPQIPWPSSGQAALDVQGIGTFGSSGDQKPVPIASVAKVMTAYVVLRDHPLKSGADGPKIKIDQSAEDQSDAGQESTVDVTAGDSITQREALQSILIASANNVARLLARWDAGSEKAFVEKMNAAAEDLGMSNTTYTDPSGLNNTTVSTAVDQVKLAKDAMKQPAFREVAAMMSYDDYKGTNHSNWNQLVGHNDVVGIKTGTTTSALGNLVFAAKKEVDGETRTVVGAVVRQPAGGADNTILGAALDSSDKLIRAAQDALESSTIVKKGTVVGYVDDGLGGRTPVVTTQDVKAAGWAGLTVKLTFDADEVPHTAAAGTKVGSLAVGDGGTSGAVKVPVALQEELVEPGFAAKLTRLG